MSSFASEVGPAIRPQRGGRNGNVDRSGRYVVANVYQDTRPCGLLCGLKNSGSSFFVNIFFAAVRTYLCRNAFENERRSVSFQRNGCPADQRFSVLTNHTLHDTLLSNPGSHWSGSGSYTVTTIVSSRSALYAITMWRLLAPLHPSTRRLGYGVSCGYSSIAFATVRAWRTSSKLILRAYMRWTACTLKINVPVCMLLITQIITDRPTCMCSQAGPFPLRLRWLGL